MLTLVYLTAILRVTCSGCDGTSDGEHGVVSDITRLWEGLGGARVTVQTSGDLLDQRHRQTGQFSFEQGCIPALCGHSSPQLWTVTSKTRLRLVEPRSQKIHPLILWHEDRKP